MFRVVLVALFAAATAACFTTSRAEDGFVSPRKDAVEKTDTEWRKALSSEQYRILRQKGTEPAFTGQYWNAKAKGTYLCGGCGLELFSSDHKYKSGTGWPSFFKVISADAVGRANDDTLGVSRTEIVCNRCGGHLGHVFPDGPPPTGKRYCVNGNALDFELAEVSK